MQYYLKPKNVDSTYCILLEVNVNKFLLEFRLLEESLLLLKIGEIVNKLLSANKQKIL